MDLLFSVNVTLELYKRNYLRKQFRSKHFGTAFLSMSVYLKSYNAAYCTWAAVQ